MGGPGSGRRALGAGYKRGTAQRARAVLEGLRTRTHIALQTKKVSYGRFNQLQNRVGKVQAIAYSRFKQGLAKMR